MTRTLQPSPAGYGMSPERSAAADRDLASLRPKPEANGVKRPNGHASLLEGRSDRTALTKAAPKNSLEALRDCTIDIGLIKEKLTKLVHSDNRHGDLQVMKQAALRFIADVNILIESEQAIL